MRILHIGLVSYYTEGMTYQENYLSEINAEAGHEVVYVSNAMKYKEGQIVDTPEEDYYLDNGIRLIRYKYDSLGFKLLTDKIQKVKRLRNLLYEFAPDSIMFHGVCGYELMDVAQYVKKHPSTLFYVDCHEDFNNTARTFAAKFFYKYIHGYFIKKALPYIRKILYIGEISRVYLKEMYHLKDEYLELYPLGGIVTSIDEQLLCRERFIENYNLPEKCVIFMHSGKMGPLKRTSDLLRAFSQVHNRESFLFIFGSFSEETEDEIKELIDQDNRVTFLGWKSGREVINLLNAADVYCQPGSPSATSQVALCCGCAEIVNPTISYKKLYEEDVLYADTNEELAEQIKRVSEEAILTEYKQRGYSRAMKVLDYRQLAERYLKE